MKQAITTRVKMSKNGHGYILAKSQVKNMKHFVSAQYAKDKDHVEAARQLAEYWGWNGAWVAGVLPNGDHVFVRIERAASGYAFTSAFNVRSNEDKELSGEAR